MELKEDIIVKIFIGGGPWTNPSKLRARHIWNENIKGILCKKQYPDSLDYYLGELRNVTCDVCRRRFYKLLPPDNPYRIGYDSAKKKSANARVACDRA
jgi:hypothetical protein